MLVDLSDWYVLHDVSLFIHIRQQHSGDKFANIRRWARNCPNAGLSLIADDLEWLEIDVQDLLFEDRIFSEAAEVQLKGATFDTHRTEGASFRRSKPEIEIFNSTEMAAIRPWCLLDVDDLLSRGVVYDEPIDVLDELFNEILD